MTQTFPIGNIISTRVAARDRIAHIAPNERQFELLCAAAPYVEQMAGRLRRPRAFTEEPASLFRFGAI
jgi:aspartyl-tRNA(Asn)/glutamyl-tRNA(Gln) amidotransferase subunit A